MRSVHVARTIPAAAEEVFGLLADHAHYDRFRGIRGSELVIEGKPAPNGVGAIRRVLIGPLRFDEEITGYERPPASTTGSCASTSPSSTRAGTSA